jgi:hypothetical protein
MFAGNRQLHAGRHRPCRVSRCCKHLALCIRRQAFARQRERRTKARQRCRRRRRCLDLRDALLWRSWRNRLLVARIQDLFSAPDVKDDCIQCSRVATPNGRPTNSRFASAVPGNSAIAGPQPDVAWGRGARSPSDVQPVGLSRSKRKCAGTNHVGVSNEADSRTVLSPTGC